MRNAFNYANDENLNKRFYMSLGLSEYMRWKIFKYALLLFIVISISIASITLYNLSQQIHPLVYDWKNLFLSIFWQVVSVIIIVASWKLNLKTNMVADLNWRETTVHIGLNSLGKYSPGKIAGSVARGLTAYKRYGNLSGILYASIIEQVAMIHSGVVLYVLLLLFGKLSYILRVGLCVIISVSLVCIPIALKFCLKYFENRYRTEFMSHSAIGKKYLLSYMYVFISLTLVWFTTALSLNFVTRGVGVESNFYESTLATILGYLSGFAAVFLPAGIGVREGVIVASMTKITTASIATTIALIMRLISISIDIIIGLVALKYSHNHEK